MKKLYITADFGDVSYGNLLVIIDEDIFSKFLPMINAINNFKPYARKSEHGGIDYCNWESQDIGLGELPISEKYPQFNEEYVDEFIEIFIDPIPVPCGGIEDRGPHTIVSLIDVMTDEILINTENLWEHGNQKNSQMKMS